MTITNIESPEDRFTKQYISSNEICERLNITPSGLTKAVERGNFIEPLDVTSNVRLWERDAVEPLLKAWEQRLTKSS